MFFYDQQLDLWINDSPLLISSKVQKAAQAFGHEVQWNSKGHVCGLGHAVSLRLAEKLGSITLSVQQFMHLARRQPRVASDEFAEWLKDQ
ncbi:hypothetical protein CLAFUW4_03785 [Fulvia fulva]|uniref:Uncharacterized protein n=1 Tax=Passalora fulva TaxID=5499 RepID=A0A9Q8P5M0_PASFU|nr:uncharacterized protein CLAFUR5_03757 [Fulvia fulva]KAK4631626.1 hypothetical protein CLAFUR4_03773 [Fulvia fulva]UJO14265.1 hypothetical protein CLAFUR5_03757 [Fulvia fulva]WPV10624.1 hypothetical protein CLAFUW4_03785 [Fulvia fulva]WPV26458.1 hypothetical protein CLAFUW7_03777 [Fulvia fulva]